MTESPFEISQTLPDLAEQNMKQAHAAYGQLAHFMIKAMGVWTDALPANPMAAVFKDVQDRVVEIATENAESALSFAGKISNAQTFQDISALQTQFVQDRIQAFVTQMLELQQLIGESFPEAATRQISPLTRHASYGRKRSRRKSAAFNG